MKKPSPVRIDHYVYECGGPHWSPIFVATICPRVDRGTTYPQEKQAEATVTYRLYQNDNMRRKLSLNFVFRCCFVALFVLQANVYAEPLTWTIQSLRFENGTTGSGSFDYDATTNIYSNINITTTINNAMFDETTEIASPTSATNPDFVPDATEPFTDLPFLRIFFESPGLTNNGGIVSMTGGFEARCTSQEPRPLLCITGFLSLESGSVSAPMPPSEAPSAAPSESASPTASRNRKVCRGARSAWLAFRETTLQ